MISSVGCRTPFQAALERITIVTCEPESGQATRVSYQIRHLGRPQVALASRLEAATSGTWQVPHESTLKQAI